MGTSPDDAFEYERLMAEKAQEMQMKEMLEQSVGELETTVTDMEKRIENMDEESNEWKTRYETQCEINQQFEAQILRLSDKCEEYKRTLHEARLPKSVRTYEEPQEVTPYHLKQMEREKASLLAQLRDMEWKLDQTAKAYHKANEERKYVQTELAAAKTQMGSVKSYHKAAIHHEKETLDSYSTPRVHGSPTQKGEQLPVWPRVSHKEKATPSAEHTDQARPSVEHTDKARPSVECSTSKDKPGVPSIIQTRPAVARASKGKPGVPSNSQTRPPVERTSKVKPGVQSDSQTKPALERVSRIKPSVQRDGHMKPAVERASKVKPGVQSDSQTRPALERASKVKPGVQSDSRSRPALERASKGNAGVQSDSQSRPAVETVSKVKSGVERTVKANPNSESTIHTKPGAASTGKANLENTIKDKAGVENTRKTKSREENMGKPRAGSTGEAMLSVQSTSKTQPSGIRNTNIAEDQRIIDPRHGPIRKTAAVKTLPRLGDNRYDY